MSINKKILLQIKFLAVAFINITYSLLPFFFLKKSFLKILDIRLGRNSYIHRGVKFFHIGGITIGNNSVINFNCYLDNRRGIKIGDNVGIANNTKIYTLGHDIDDSEFKTKGSPVIIENNVFIFSNVLIMPGVTIHEGAVVLAGSVVTKSIAPYSVVGGNPAKFIRNRSSIIQYKNDYGYWYAL